MNRHSFTAVSLVQTLYFLLTGLWPLVDIYTFQLMTGPKTDLWLVKTVGLLITVIAVILLIATLRQHITLEIRLLAVGSAAGLAGIDIIYVALGRISPIYLLDAFIELALVVWWTVTWRKERARSREPQPIP